MLLKQVALRVYMAYMCVQLVSHVSFQSLCGITKNKLWQCNPVCCTKIKEEDKKKPASHFEKMQFLWVLCRRKLFLLNWRMEVWQDNNSVSKYLLSLLEAHRKLSVQQELLLNMTLESVLLCTGGCWGFLASDEEQYVDLFWEWRRALCRQETGNYQDRLSNTN